MAPEAWPNSNGNVRNGSNPAEASRQVLTPLHPRSRHSLPTGCIQDRQEMADFGAQGLTRATCRVSGLRQFNQFNDLAKSGTLNPPTRKLCFLARVSHRGSGPPSPKSAVPRPRHCLKVLIGLEVAHDFMVSTFGGIEHLRVDALPVNEPNSLGCHDVNAKCGLPTPALWNLARY
jgi:hypothetical protein